jgi:hypothetical protein
MKNIYAVVSGYSKWMVAGLISLIVALPALVSVGAPI